MCDKSGIVSTSIHPYKVLLIGNTVFLGPNHNVGNQILSPKNGIGCNSVNVDCLIIVTMLPNLGVGKGNGPNTGQCPIDFNLPNTLLLDFGFHHGPFKYWPLIQGKFNFLIRGGHRIEPENGVQIFGSAINDFQEMLLNS